MRIVIATNQLVGSDLDLWKRAASRQIVVTYSTNQEPIEEFGSECGEIVIVPPHNLMPSILREHQAYPRRTIFQTSVSKVRFAA